MSDIVGDSEDEKCMELAPSSPPNKIASLIGVKGLQYTFAQANLELIDLSGSPSPERNPISRTVTHPPTSPPRTILSSSFPIPEQPVPAPKARPKPKPAIRPATKPVISPSDDEILLTSVTQEPPAPVAPPKSPQSAQPKEPKAKKPKAPKEPKPKKPRESKKITGAKADKAFMSRELIESDAGDDANDPALAGPSAHTLTKSPKVNKKSRRTVVDSDDEEYDGKPRPRKPQHRRAADQTPRDPSPSRPSPSHPSIPPRPPSPTGKRKADSNGDTPRSSKSRKKTSDDSPGRVAPADAAVTHTDHAPSLSALRGESAAGGGNRNSDVEMTDARQVLAFVDATEPTKTKKSKKSKEKENVPDDTPQATTKSKKAKKKKSEIQPVAPAPELPQEQDEEEMHATTAPSIPPLEKTSSNLPDAPVPSSLSPSRPPPPKSKHKQSSSLSSQIPPKSSSGMSSLLRKLGVHTPGGSSMLTKGIRIAPLHIRLRTPPPPPPRMPVPKKKKKKGEDSDIDSAEEFEGLTEKEKKALREKKKHTEWYSD